MSCDGANLFSAIAVKDYMTIKKRSANNFLKIGELPTLEVVSGKNLILHEDPDDERLLNLVDRLGADGILKNPPIAARIGNKKRYVILDGANRVTALSKLGFRHFLVQVVDFEDALLKLHCWNHAIEKLTPDYFEKNIRKIRGVEIIKFNRNNRPAADLPDFSLDDKSFCHFSFKNGRGFYVRGDGSILHRIDQLRNIADLYIHQPVYDRVSYSNRNHLEKHYPQFSALLTYRRIEKDDFLKFIESNKKLPAGITRVFLPKRALGLNTPLEFLKSELTLDEKNRWLDEMITRRVRDKSIRFYREPTFVFDE